MAVPVTTDSPAPRPTCPPDSPGGWTLPGHSGTSPEARLSSAWAGTLGSRAREGRQGQSSASSLSLVLLWSCARQRMRGKKKKKPRFLQHELLQIWKSHTQGSATFLLFIIQAQVGEPQQSENKQCWWLLQEGLGTSHALNLKINLKNGKGKERKADQKTRSR